MSKTLKSTIAIMFIFTLVFTFMFSITAFAEPEDCCYIVATAQCTDGWGHHWEYQPKPLPPICVYVGVWQCEVAPICN